MISIVLATYNGEKFIKEQLESILKQTKRPDEVIIQDDGSTDDTLNIINKFIKDNNPENWKLFINKQNKGYVMNFTTGLKNASGDMIFLCDQDDIWNNDKIEKMTQIMEENKNIELLMCNVQPFYIENCKNKIHHESFGNKKIIKFKFNGHWVNTPRPGCSFLIRKTLLKDYFKLINKNIPHDNLLWQISNIKETAYLYNKTEMKYRRHSNNASRNVKPDYKIRLEAIQKQLQDIDNIKNYYYIKKDVEKRKFLEKQEKVFLKRYDYIKNRKFINYIFLIKDIKYYVNLRWWLTDLYYIMKSR